MITSRSTPSLVHDITRSKVSLFNLIDKLRNKRIFHNITTIDLQKELLYSLYIENLEESPYEYLNDDSISLMLKQINIK